MAVKIISKQTVTPLAYLRRLKDNVYLVGMLARRELKIKYAQTFLGIGWFFLQPLAVVAVYSLFFKYLIKINSDGIPYAPFVFSGLVFWYLFTGIVSRCTFALPESSELIHKVAFPRMVVLLAKSIPVVFECLVLLLLLFATVPVYGIFPAPASLFALFYFAEVCLLGLAVGLFFSIIALRFRDFSHILPTLINFAIWITPVFYPASLVPRPYRGWLACFNPLVIPINSLRDAVFYNKTPGGEHFLIVLITLLLLVSAFLYFVKFEKKITETI